MLKYWIRRRLDIQREIHDKNKLNESQAEEEIVKAIKNSEENLRLLSKSNKSNLSINFDNDKKSSVMLSKNCILSSSSNLIETKDSIKIKRKKKSTIVPMNQSATSITSKKISPYLANKSKQSLYSNGLLEKNNEFSSGSSKLINRSTSINGSDLNYTQINNKDTYSKILNIFNLS